MSGKRLLLDMNAIIALLQAHQQVVEVTNGADWIGISVISQLEFLSFSGLTRADEELFRLFCARIEIVGLRADDIRLMDRVIEFRNCSHLKLPDAIVAATTVVNDATLVTADQRLATLTKLRTVSFQP